MDEINDIIIGIILNALLIFVLIYLKQYNFISYFCGIISLGTYLIIINELRG